MKPIGDVSKFLARFENFKDAEFRSVEIISPTSMLVTLAAQDNARAFDWISLKLELSGVSDAQLLDNTKLSLVDMSEGLSIVKEDTSIIFGIGEYTNSSSIKNSALFIECSNIKYEEDLF